MVQLRQDLALMAEQVFEGRIAAPIAHQFEGGLLTIFAVVALGQVDDAHAAAADLAEDSPGSFMLRRRGIFRGGSGAPLRSGQEGLGEVLAAQVLFDFTAQLGIVRAGAGEDAVAVLLRRREGLFEHGLYARPGEGIHARACP